MIMFKNSTKEREYIEISVSVTFHVGIDKIGTEGNEKGITQYVNKE